ncbi:hypothetical protein KSS87_004353, partial [Heliosperma pusillum]
MKNEDSLFTQGVKIKTMGNKGRLNVHTRSYIAKKWVMKERRLIVHTRSYNANNGCKQWVLKKGGLIFHTRT